jgi:hypothetical protein
MTPNPFDQACRYLAKRNPGGMIAWLLPGLSPTVRFRCWLDTRSIPFPGEPERVCDTVAHLVDTSTKASVPWALAIEFQRQPAATMFGRLLEYLGRLWRELPVSNTSRQGLSVAAAVVNLKGRGSSSKTMKLPGTEVQTILGVAERNLMDEDAAKTLQQIAEGGLDRCILPWIPLMRDGASADIIGEWKALAAADPDQRRRGDWAGLALVFAEAAQAHALWKQALEGWNVETSQQVLEWQAEALQRGLTEGKAKGKAEGKAEAKAEDVISALRLRFGKKLPKQLQRLISQTTDLGLLDRWLEAAITAESLDAFRARTSL